MVGLKHGLKVHVQANHVAPTDSIVQTVDARGTAEEADTIAWCLRWLFIEQVVHRQEDIVGTASFTGKVIAEGEVGNEHGINRVVILFTRGAEPVLGPTIDVLAVQEGPEVVTPVGQVGQEAVGGIGSVQESLLVHPGPAAISHRCCCQANASSGSHHRQRS